MSNHLFVQFAIYERDVRTVNSRVLQEHVRIVTQEGMICLLWHFNVLCILSCGLTDELIFLRIKRPKLAHPTKVPQVQPSGDQVLFSDDEELIRVSPPPVSKEMFWKQ